MTDYEKSHKDIRKAIEVQLTDGNWNLDRYMHGMANGMIYCESVLSGAEPEFKEAPEKWIEDEALYHNDKIKALVQKRYGTSFVVPRLPFLMLTCLAAYGVISLIGTGIALWG